MIIISTYLDILNRRFQTGISREHSYRGDLQLLLMTLLPDILVTNEPARVACGAPDYLLTRNDIPVGYIEAKDIGIDLKSKGLKEQFDRYKAGLSNLVFTDYLDFHFYRDGVLTTSVAIAYISEGKIVALPENFERFSSLIQNFALTVSQTIKSPTKLAEMMAGKAKLMADVIERSLNADDETDTKSALKGQMQSFQQMLIHDIDNSGFADIYAQTIAYGMFAARYHDPTLPTFSRQEAATLIPRSNPFLRRLFQDIAGYDLDDRLVWIVDELVNIFLAADVAVIMSNFGRSTKQEDPVVHFYETFLAAYNPTLRKARGVWYTPQPVVNFIVRAVDDILKTEFKLPQGLADTSKVKIKTKHVTKATTDRNSKLKEVETEREVHKVQILDPATGTGTFLAEVVRHIYKKFEGQQGIWSNYVSQHLIPRLNGFELLMASYAMAHLKMDMLLTETGYQSTTDQRFRIFLTNSLEEAHPDSRTLFSSWLSDEADQANAVKRETPVMVVMGNPPYRAESGNRGQWIMNLLEDYKKEPGGKEKLDERNSKSLNDDYVKFLRFAQYFVENNENGIVAFINPHGFLDNPTFRGMRWNLLKTYDRIYVIDLHGNSKKKETAPDGSADHNVFDIMQGVSINIFIKTGRKKDIELGKVLHFDLFGKREKKYSFLSNNILNTIDFQELPNISPDYFFVRKDFKEQQIYDKGFLVTDLFVVNGVGLTTAHDEFVIDEDESKLLKLFQDFQNTDRDTDLLHNKFNVKKKVGWNILKGYDEIKNEKNLLKFIEAVSYRPFDNRYIFYEDNLVWRTVRKVMHHFLEPNIGISLIRRSRNDGFVIPFVINKIADKSISSTLDNAAIFPLYTYPKKSSQQTIVEQTERIPNLNPLIVDEISGKLCLSFTNEKEEASEAFAPIDILDYIYAVLHSPNYREIYKEFLKIDFPRVPYPKDAEEFWRLVKIGGELRRVHLLEADVTEQYITQYPTHGDNEVGKVRYQLAEDQLKGKVWINETQYFEGVPLAAWEFYIGGYQPAQKWLKDRKGRKLGFEDILHYQKIIVALTETGKLMEEVDRVGENISDTRVPWEQ